ncbi:SDR family NAD(P)-dependent oxidoreductase [Nguyenibacter vanlangensis]|uniref:SDR family NAD(P)-dependent oxidoreductase n=1 Tax=Nguyenibacter vanlangensis TaxID=1216886 RepID=A0ABZ3D394_9PROT
MSYQNKVALVTGANRGIGAAITRELLKSNVAKVYATARRADSLPHFGDSRVVPLQLDVTSDTSVANAIHAAKDVDILINNAGTMAYGNWIDSAQDVIEADMNTNFYGTLRVTRAFLPQFTSRGSGTIANVVSIVGLAPVPLLAGYSASKAALQSFTQSLRGTLAKSGITVLGIYPGPVDTDLAKGIPLAKEQPEVVAAKIIQGIAESQSYIFPDAMALQVELLWASNGRELEVALRAAEEGAAA